MSTIEQASRRLERLGPSPGGAARIIAPAKQARGAAPDPGARLDIDLPALREAGYLTPDAPRSRLLDEFRAVKRPLLGNLRGSRVVAPAERGNLIMITSSLPGEGKTFTSINLALSLAMELDHEVLLVDADTTRTTLTRRLGLDAGRRGLLDILRDGMSDAASCEARTQVPGLSVLTAGAPDARAPEILGGAALGHLLEGLAAQREGRVVVFDAPPLLSAPEARVLAPQMGQIVLVVGAGSTHQGTVAQSLALLTECPLVMTLLNRARGPAAESPYGYYAY